MPEKEKVKPVDLICDACGRRGCVHLNSPLAEAIHARMPQDKVTEVLCSKCAEMRRKQDHWTVTLGKDVK